MARQFTRASSHYLSTAVAVPSAMPLTMACWFMVPDVNTEYSLMTRASAGNHRHAMRVRGDLAGDYLQLNASDGSTLEISTTTSVVANVWQHACVSIASSTSRTVYLNGGGKVTGTGAITPATTSLWIGASNSSGSPTQFLNGSIAEAAVWNTALTDEDVMALARGVCPASVMPSALVLYAPLVRGLQDLTSGLVLTDTGTSASDHSRIYLPS